MRKGVDGRGRWHRGRIANRIGRVRSRHVLVDETTGRERSDCRLNAWKLCGKRSGWVVWCWWLWRGDAGSRHGCHGGHRGERRLRRGERCGRAGGGRGKRCERERHGCVRSTAGGTT